MTDIRINGFIAAKLTLETPLIRAPQGVHQVTLRWLASVTHTDCAKLLIPNP